MTFNIGFAMDAAILILLAGTIFLAFRLNLNLKHFRDGRKDMEKLVATLTVNIERAEKAIAGLQIGARNSGSDLDKKIKESKFLIDELKFMGEAGNNLADRLEKLADRNRELVEKIEARGGIGPGTALNHAPPAIESTIIVREAAAPAGTAAAGFSIHDREFDDGDGDMFDSLDEELEQANIGLQSQAEREFFQALQKRKSAGRN